MEQNHVLLVGAGPMAIEYGKVLSALKTPYTVVGRGETSALAFEKAVGVPVIQGGITEALVKEGTFSHAIVAVPVEQLAPTTSALIQYGMRKILCEKPGGLNTEEITNLYNLAKEKGVEVFIAYNRHFYASTRKAREIIQEDGGVLSFFFEFTEWSHKIEPIATISVATKREWFLANSSHVADLAFFLGGSPEKISSYVSGANVLSWHPQASIYAGSGVTKNGALFSYSANWQSAGRWGVELQTPKHRLILRPLEKLFIQELGSVETKEVTIDDALDVSFKPGLYLETKSFLEGSSDLVTLEVQVQNLEHYKKIENPE